MVPILQVLTPVCSQEQNPNQWNCATCDKNKHQIDWENTIFLDSETHWRQRKIKEALYIDSLNPGKQISNNIMNLEKGFDISGCWKEFSSDIRKKLSSKIPNLK